MSSNGSNSLNFPKTASNNAKHNRFGHEYTYKNLQFAVSVMGSSTNLEKREKLVIQALNDKKTTMPFKILEEKQTNPFMLCDNAYWKEFFKMPEAKGEEVFAALRSKRDVF